MLFYQLDFWQTQQEAADSVLFFLIKWNRGRLLGKMWLLFLGLSINLKGLRSEGFSVQAPVGAKHRCSDCRALLRCPWARKRCSYRASLQGPELLCSFQALEKAGPTWAESPVHVRALSEHLWVWNLAQGYLSSVLMKDSPSPTSESQHDLYFENPVFLRDVVVTILHHGLFLRLSILWKPWLHI